MAAISRAHRTGGDDSLFVLTAQTGCRASCSLLRLHLPCQVTQARHDHQHYGGHAQHYPTYSEETTRRSRQLDHHIRAAFFTTACRPLAIPWLMKTTASIVDRDLDPWTVALCSSRTYSPRSESTSTSTRQDLPAQIASPTFASTLYVQMDRSDTSHLASGEGDHHLPPRGVLLAQKIKRPC